MVKMHIALVLLLRFGYEVVRSGLTTAWLIMRPRRRPLPGLIRMRYGGLSETGVVALACMMSLTPGSTAIDIDQERGELLLHVLDARDPRALIGQIRSRFESPLQRLFPAREPA